MSMLRELQELGLNPKEAKVYIACFEVGEGSAQRIAGKCGMAKSTVADILKTLNKKGLISVAVRKSRRMFSASDLSVFEEKMKRQKEAFDKIHPELYALFNSKRQKPKIKFFESKEGMGAIINEVLDEAKEMIGFGSNDVVFRKMTEYFPDFPKRRAKKGIPIKLILQDTAFARERKKNGKYELREVRIAKTGIPYQSLVWVWNNKIAMIGLGDDINILLIENSEFASMMKAFFQLLWEKLDE